MKKRLLVILITVIVLFVAAVPAAAITDGHPDGEGHPHVVLIIMDIGGQPAYRCSGTLLSPTIVLTAGHCAGAPDEFSGMRIFTESNVQDGDNTYPSAGGPNSIEALDWAAHPDYPDYPFIYNDVGMIQLSESLNLDEYGTLPEVDQLDVLKTKRGKQNTTFTAVGYGLQESFPDAASWKNVAYKIRYVAYPKLIQINVPGFTGDFSLLLSNNPNTGGTCFGDSGGPNFLGDSNVVAGVTSFGINSNCAGTGGVFRMDRQNVLDFVNDFISTH